MAYTLKSASRTDLGRDVVVMPLQGLWWAADMNSFTRARDKSQWDRTLMIMMPDWITDEMFAAAVHRVRARNRPPRLDDVRLETLAEGLCVQALHIGPYDDEAALIRRIHEEFVPARNLTVTGQHHEVYLSDPRRVEPARLRTIVRQPVSPSLTAPGTIVSP